MIDFIIAAIIAAAMAAILWKKVKGHRTGNNGCSCGSCGGCSGGCGTCSSNTASHEH